EAYHLVAGQRRERDLVQTGAARAEDLERAREPMRRSDVVVAIRADDEQVRDAGIAHQVLDELQRRGVQPLEIVEKQDQRMLRTREHGEESRDRALETVLRLVRRDLGDRRLLAEDQLELRHETRDDVTVHVQRLADGISPSRELALPLAEDHANEALQGHRERRVWNVALVLVELPRGEQTASERDRAMQLVNDRRLADSRRAGDQDEPRLSVGGDAFEGLEQLREVRLTSVQSLGDDQIARKVLDAQVERLDPSL